MIKVSKELMGVFRYIEKAKRQKIQELADTLRQVINPKFNLNNLFMVTSYHHFLLMK